MTHQLIKKLCLTGCILLVPFLVHGQEAITLSISPTIFDMSAEPGQTWNSTLRVINVNPFDLTVYADVVNFAPQGEGGDGRFLPVIDSEADGDTLAEWITISREPIIVPREQTMEIPLSVHVPVDASPGGHFAAILVGTKPIQGSPEEAKIQTAQMVTSLFFSRVAGDVIESGSIREFTTEKTFLNSPEATFSLRFENKGNVHLQPRGEIKILNMWGEERGIIPINQYTKYGNVLPNSIRKFSFTWKGEWSISDIGKYRAIATLGYGTDEKKFTTAQTTFWVIPFTLLFWLILGLGTFIAITVWLVRLYVRHVLSMAGINIKNYQTLKAESRGQEVSKVRRLRSLRTPVDAGLLDLTERLRSKTSLSSRATELYRFIIQYRLFFFGALLGIGFIVVVAWYVTNANTKHRAYEVLYINNDETTTPVSSEEILYDQLRASQNIVQDPAFDESLPTVSVVNRSGVPGRGAEVRLLLEQRGYKVTSLSADFTSPQSKTVIVYTPAQKEAALGLSPLLDNALLSVSADEDHTELVIYVGSDVTKL